MKIYPLLDYLGGPALAALFLLFLGLESWRPLRRWVQSRWERLLTNGAAAATAAITMRLSLVPAVVWVASWVQQSQWVLVFLHQRPTWLLPNGVHPERAGASDPLRLAP